MNVESLIFDMDGTLWDSGENIAASWTEILRTQPEARIITAEAIHRVMGMPMDRLAAIFFPDCDEARRMELLELCATYENEYLALHGGVLYDGLEETLATLAQNHRLFIVSNCQCGYIEAFLEYYDFGKYIQGHLCWGDTGTSKGDTIRTLMAQHDITSAAYVGDIQGDCDSARHAGIGFIHAAYGFGQVAEPDAVIHSITELLDIVS